MEYIRAVLVQIPATSMDEAARPDGLLAELDEHQRFLQEQPGFLGMRITRSINPEGNVLLVVETRWQDEAGLAQYGAQEPNAASIITKYDHLTVAGSLQVSDMEDLAAAPGRAPSEVTERLALPLLVPLGIFVFAILIVYGLSRIYLEVPNDVATGLALGIAVGILGVSWYLASNPYVPRWQIGSIFVLAVALLLGGGIYAGVHEEEGATEAAAASPTAEASPAAETTPAADAPSVTLNISAVNIAFDTDRLEAPADQPFIISFENQENQPHNVSIYTDDSATEPLFVGEIFSGPDRTVDYEIPPLPAGEYFFRCDVHPVQMTGTLVVE